MAIKIFSALVAIGQRLGERKYHPERSQGSPLFITLLLSVSLICTTALAEDSDANTNNSAVFFDRNFARTPLDGDDIHANESQRGSNNRLKKHKEYQESIQDRASQANKRKKDLNSDSKPQTKESQSTEQPLGEQQFISEQSTEHSTQAPNANSIEPISIKKNGNLEITAYISVEPHAHFLKELEKVKRAKEMRGITVKEVVAIGKPFSNKEFVQIILKLNPKETPVRFLLELPGELNFEYSPTWILNIDARLDNRGNNGAKPIAPKRWVFEGPFDLEEIIEQ